MNYKRLFSPETWRLNLKLFKELYNYDLAFNASFRNVEKLPKQLLNKNEFKYLRYYRIAQATQGSIWFKFFFFPRLVKFSVKTGIGLHDNLNIPKGLIIGHSGTIVINSDAVFGGNLMLTHNVTIGRDVRGKRKGAPTFGKNVCIRCNSTVVGKVMIGDDVLIAPNTFVNFDVPSHSVVVGNPGVIHQRENATEGHLGIVRDH